MLKKLLESGKAIALLPSLSLFVGAVFLGFYGIYVLFETLYKVLTDESARDTAVLATKFISVMDIHLLSVILYIFSVGLYELFVGELKLAPWLKIETIDQLKSKLTSVIVLILAITFTKNFVEWKNPLDTLLFGLAVSAVIGVLIFYYKIKSEH